MDQTKLDRLMTVTKRREKATVKKQITNRQALLELIESGEVEADAATKASLTARRDELVEKALRDPKTGKFTSVLEREDGNIEHSSPLGIIRHGGAVHPALRAALTGKPLDAI